jgi:hypothetical protein
MSADRSRFAKVFRWHWIPEAVLVSGTWEMIQFRHFLAAYACFAVAVLWGALSWLFSNTVYRQFLIYDKTRRRRNPDKPNTLLRFRHEFRKLWTMRMGGTLTAAAIMVAGCLYIHWEAVGYEMSLLYGRLYPANDKLFGPCAPPTGYVALYAGNVGAQVPLDMLPMTLVEVGGKRVIVLDRGSDGSLVLIADIKDKDDKLIVRMNKKEFRVNPNNYFDVYHSRSELRITDQAGDVALDARYNNDRIFSVRGKLYVNGRLVDFSSRVAVGSRSVSNICFSLSPGLKGQKLAVLDAP